MSRNKRRNRRNTSGGKSAANRRGPDTVESRSADAVVLRSSSETKSSLKTTELIAYAAAALAVVMTALAVDGDAEGRNDPFGAEEAIRYITYLTIGYMVARGLAKSGSIERRVDHADDDHDAARSVVVEDADGGDDEGDRRAAEREAAEREEAEREEAEREAAERKEAERKAAERKEAERKAAERKEAEREEAQRKAAEREREQQHDAEQPTVHHEQETEIETVDTVAPPSDDVHDAGTGTSHTQR